MNQEIEVEAFKLPLVIFFHFLQYCIFKISKLAFNIPKVKSHFRLKPTDFKKKNQNFIFQGNFTVFSKISQMRTIRFQISFSYSSNKCSLSTIPQKLLFKNSIICGGKKLNQFEKKILIHKTM